MEKGTDYYINIGVGGRQVYLYYIGTTHTCNNSSTDKYTTLLLVSRLLEYRLVNIEYSIYLYTNVLYRIDKQRIYNNRHFNVSAERIKM